MRPEELLELLREIEIEDPVNFDGLPFAADDLRMLACLNVADIINHISEETPAHDRELMMGATVTRLVLENMILQARLAILADQDS